MHNIGHERRPSNTLKPTSTLSNLSGLSRWLHYLKLCLFVCVYLCVCVCRQVLPNCILLESGTSGYFQISWIEKWGGNSVIGSRGQKWSRSTQRSTLRISNLLRECLFWETCCLATHQLESQCFQAFVQAPMRKHLMVNNLNLME